MTKPIDRAALAQVRDLTLGHAGADAPRCDDCGDRLPRGADARVCARRHRGEGGRWRHRVYCAECGSLSPTFGADEFLFATRLTAGRIGASTRPALIASSPRTVERSLAGDGRSAGRDPATEGAD